MAAGCDPLYKDFNDVGWVIEHELLLSVEPANRESSQSKLVRNGLELPIDFVIDSNRGPYRIRDALLICRSLPSAEPRFYFRQCRDRERSERAFAVKDQVADQIAGGFEQPGMSKRTTIQRLQS